MSPSFTVIATKSGPWIAVSRRWWTISRWRWRFSCARGLGWSRQHRFKSRSRRIWKSLFAPKYSSNWSRFTSWFLSANRAKWWSNRPGKNYSTKRSMRHMLITAQFLEIIPAIVPLLSSSTCASSTMTITRQITGLVWTAVIIVKLCRLTNTGLLSLIWEIQTIIDSLCSCLMWVEPGCGLRKFY